MNIHTAPHIELLLAPAAAGKTRAVIERLRMPRSGRAVVIVPNVPQVDAFRARLGASRRARVVQFYAFAASLLRHAGAVPPLLDATAQITLVRQLLFDMHAAGHLPTFARVAHKPGFVAAVAELLLDLGNADITPAAFTAAAQTPHDHELAAVYARYKQFQVEHGLANLPRSLQLAREALRDNPALLRATPLIAVDGFDQFAPVQLHLLAEVARHVPETIVTLTGSPERRTAHRRFARTLADLEQVFNINMARLHVEPSRCSLALHQLEAALFELDVPEPVDAAGVISVIEAADREREVRAVLRHVKQLVEHGTPADSIAVLFRSGVPYRKLLQEVAAEYHLPLVMEDGMPLAEAPPIVALLSLLRLHVQDYPRRQLVEALRNPYISSQQSAISSQHAEVEPACQLVSLSACQLVTALDAVARHAAIVGGLAAWRAAFERLAALTEADVADNDSGVPLWGAEAAAAQAAFEQLVAWLAPLDPAPVAAHVAWTHEHLSALTIGGEDNPFFERDAAAVARFKEVLDGLAQTAALLLDTSPVPFDVFWSSLEGAVAAARFRVKQQHGVVVTSVLAARGRTWDHVCLLGLSEGEFPQPLPEPAIYSRAERRAMQERGMFLNAPDPADERTIFYEAVTRACSTLLFSRTRLDESGTPLPRSPYLKALLQIVHGVNARSVAAGSVPPWDEAASPHERALALAETLNHRQSPASSQQAPKTQLVAVECAPAATANWRLTAESWQASIINAYPAWPHVVRARQIEAWREGLGNYGPHEGVNDDTAAVALVAAQFGPEYRWSATQFNDYSICPFRFAAAHVLHLRQHADPEDTLDSALRGQVLHAIMARTGERWRRSRIALTSDNQDAALTQLDLAAQEVLDAAPERFGFVPGAFWSWERSEMQRRVRAACEHVLRTKSDWDDFTLARVEQGFGGARGLPPLNVTTPVGPVLVRGRIDRVDQRPDGALAVIDYKSSSTPRSTRETINGNDLQLPIYVMAVEQVLRLDTGQRVERAAFFHLGSGKRGGELREDQLRAALDTARERIAETVASVQSADFRVRPRDTCPDYCQFVVICRRNLAKKMVADT